MARYFSKCNIEEIENSWIFNETFLRDKNLKII
jgi:hypothetical protein